MKFWQAFNTISCLVAVVVSVPMNHQHARGSSVDGLSGAQSSDDKTYTFRNAGDGKHFQFPRSRLKELGYDNKLLKQAQFHDEMESDGPIKLTHETNNFQAKHVSRMMDLIAKPDQPYDFDEVNTGDQLAVVDAFDFYNVHVPDCSHAACRNVVRQQAAPHREAVNQIHGAVDQAFSLLKSSLAELDMSKLKQDKPIEILMIYSRDGEADEYVFDAKSRSGQHAAHRNMKDLVKFDKLSFEQMEMVGRQVKDKFEKAIRGQGIKLVDITMANGCLRFTIVISDQSGQRLGDHFQKQMTMNQQ
ncbi:hypothetical protein MP228_003895 [Amoeboaphelidium protococcarum]|nr:hypothetical protein MP228_003895 [Amoeboaphelidium protococcarum]